MKKYRSGSATRFKLKQLKAITMNRPSGELHLYCSASKKRPKIIIGVFNKKKAPAIPILRTRSSFSRLFLATLISETQLPDLVLLLLLFMLFALLLL